MIFFKTATISGSQFDIRVMKIFIFPNFITFSLLLEYISIYYRDVCLSIGPIDTGKKKPNPYQHCAFSQFSFRHKLGTKLHAMEARFY